MIAVIAFKGKSIAGRLLSLTSSCTRTYPQD
jgi:hypothetical protein